MKKYSCKELLEEYSMNTLWTEALHHEKYCSFNVYCAEEDPLFFSPIRKRAHVIQELSWDDEFRIKTIEQDNKGEITTRKFTVDAKVFRRDHIHKNRVVLILSVFSIIAFVLGVLV